ncbi:MAG TPA: murein L,D-transpeptidase, partial [Actinobacteria bacterium]|nr:murein L,D-transpeptidase [Actinomycetota bacterium]
DVNLSAQTVTLYEHNQQVRTMICSSGSKATPSLTGTYAVYAKAEKLDMEGEDYSAPDVPWVLMFNGDYTIHGNYWATTFGVPSSHGCVGLPVTDAEFLYNWAPIGTIVSIHY